METLLSVADLRSEGRGVPALLARGVRALETDGDLQGGRVWFRAAYRAAEDDGDPAAMAEAAVGTAGWWVGEQRTAVEAELLRSRLKHVLSLLAPDTAPAARVRTRLAAEESYRTGEPEAVLTALDEARRAGDPVFRAEALSLAHHCLRGPDHAAGRRAIADELLGEAARGGRRQQLLMGLLCQTVDLFLDGDQNAPRRLAELRAELTRGEHLATAYVVAAIEVMLRIRAGQLADAERLAHECYGLGVRAGDPDARAWLSAHLAAIYWFSGRAAELLPVMADQVDNPELSTVDHSFRGGLAVASAAAGDRRTAAAAMIGLLDGLPRTGNWLVTMYCATETAAVLGDADAAAEVYRQLLPYRDHLMMAGMAVACFGSVEHALGVASLVTGHLDRAVGHLERAVRRNLAAGHWPAVLYSRLRLAEALGRRNGPGDLQAAAALRDEAVSATGDQAATAAGAGAARLTRTGQRWRLELDGRVAYLRDGVGVLHLAVLIANPRAEICALDLVSGLAAVEGRAAGKGRATTVTTSEVRVAGSRMSPQPLLDATAVRQFRQRLAELPEGSPEHAWLEAELAAGTGLAGRPRAFRDDTERARLAVSRAIHRTIAAVTHADGVLGAHLKATVHTGARCWYRP